MSGTAAVRTGQEAFLASAGRLLEREPAGTPLFLKRLRREGLEAFGRLGFPSNRDEEWRYTDVSPVANGVFVPAPGTGPAAGRAADGERRDALALDAWLGPLAFSPRAEGQIVFLNGRFVPEWSSGDGIPDGAAFEPLSKALRSRPDLLERWLGRIALPGDHPFSALNTAHLPDGVLLHVPRGVVLDEPLRVYWLTAASGGEPAMVSPRALVVLEEGAHATLVEVFAGSGPVAFVNAVTEAALAPASLLTHVKLQREGPETLHVGNVVLAQEGESRSRSHLFSFGGKLVRNELSVRLDGEGAGTELNGLFCATGAQRVDNHTLIVHARPRGESRELYKGILDGSARGAFDGRIVVQPAARRTDARQTNRNLILSDTALVDSKPQLEIFNNDVKCSHGSTTGRLDETMLFYLRSRGLDEAEARSLLTYAFGSEVVGKAPASRLRAGLEASLRSWLSGAGAPPEAP